MTHHTCDSCGTEISTDDMRTAEVFSLVGRSLLGDIVESSVLGTFCKDCKVKIEVGFVEYVRKVKNA